jgi:D-beta-D-heptose 7-phosphate kinase/D-beta-D-heptose 1-phosphate adenosyltransferase
LNEALVRKIKPAPILVAGDVMVDEYILGDVERISPESPVPVVVARDRLRRLGGAGNVVRNLVSLGGKVALFGTVGKDEAGEWFRSHCESRAIETFWLKDDPGRPTTIKTRVVARNQQIVRIDEEQARELDASTEEAIAGEIKKVVPQVWSIIVSDYGKGFLTSKVLGTLLESGRKNRLPTIVDPKGMDYRRYKGASYITPNIREASMASGIEIRDRSSMIMAGKTLLDHAEAEGIIITRGREGMTLITRKKDQDFHVKPVEIVDVTGAGDTVVSALALALASGLSIEEAIELANLAASLVVSRFGAAWVTLEEMAESLRGATYGRKRYAQHAIGAILRNHRIRGQSIVFTNGCFDLFHVGHLEILRRAASLGDVLVVGVNSDSSVARIKGPGRPIIGEAERIELLSALSFVQYVVVFDEDTPLNLIKEVRPDILVKGEDWRGKHVVGEDVVSSRGGRVAFVKHVPGVSTSEILRKIRACADTPKQAPQEEAGNPSGGG